MDIYQHSRRDFLRHAAAMSSLGALPWRAFGSENPAGIATPPLQELDYGQVRLAEGYARQQFDDSLGLLMRLDEASLLKPLRQMSGQNASGIDLGGWYHYDPNYDPHSQDNGFAPSATFGQWVSALARGYALTGNAAIRDKVLRLNRSYAETISTRYYEVNRFPAYCYDKLVGGLVDAHRWAGDPDAFRILELTTEAALPQLPGRAVPHGQTWRAGTYATENLDESYTISENLFKAYAHGAGDRYRTMGTQYLADYLFKPLSVGQDSLAGQHAYSHVNALGSAMAAWFTLGSAMHFQAAQQGFALVQQQSYATGGWGPDEQLRAAASDDVFASLTTTHNSFETPCGCYAHGKLTRALLRATGDSRYGDSMERIFWNTMLGALPMQEDGRAFYYADCNRRAQKVYSDHRWPCCAGTFPQVAADFALNAYLRDLRGLYVNLYLPSTVRWMQGSTAATLTLRGDYPFAEHVSAELSLPRMSRFALNFRIPAWAQGARIAVNGRQIATPEPGQFAVVERDWRDGDRVELEFPMKLSLEALNAKHLECVALIRGPLVLCGIGEPPRLTRQTLLAARSAGARTWRADSGDGAITLRPFVEIGPEPYTTYFDVT